MRARHAACRRVVMSARLVPSVHKLMLLSLAFAVSANGQVSREFVGRGSIPQSMREWACSDVQLWVESMPGQLEQYGRLFKENAIDGDLLVAFDDEMLRDIGINNKLHRKQLLKQIERAPKKPVKGQDTARIRAQQQQRQQQRQQQQQQAQQAQAQAQAQAQQRQQQQQHAPNGAVNRAQSKPAGNNKSRTTDSVDKSVVEDSGEFSTATGYGTTASGSHSTAMGYGTVASGQVSTAMGGQTIASGGTSTAFGAQTRASGLYATAIGYGTNSTGESATAMGALTSATGLFSTSMGARTKASGPFSTAMGGFTTASGLDSTSMGARTIASGIYSTSSGYGTVAKGEAASAMGGRSTASGPYSASLGYATAAVGESSTAMGGFTVAAGSYSTAMGYSVQTNENEILGVSGKVYANSFLRHADSRLYTNVTTANPSRMLANIRRLRVVDMAASENYQRARSGITPLGKDKGDCESGTCAPKSPRLSPGLLAQEVEVVIPSAVHSGTSMKLFAPEDKENPDRPLQRDARQVLLEEVNGVKSIDIAAIQAQQVGAIQALAQLVEQQAQQIAAMSRELRSLRGRIDSRKPSGSN